MPKLKLKRAFGLGDGIISAFAACRGPEDGHLGILDPAGGHLGHLTRPIFDEAVNGQKAHNGSFDCMGPVIAGGVFYVDSGYGQWGGMPGDVLLAFSVDGK